MSLLSRSIGAVSTLVALSCLLWSASPALADSCPNAQYRTGPSSGLPDCRAWEQVSPVDKNGGDAVTLEAGSIGMAMDASPDGDKFGYVNLSGYGNAAANLFEDGYMAARDQTGWGTVNVTPPSPYDDFNRALLIGYDFSPDLSRVVEGVADGPLAPNSPSGVQNLYLRGADGGYSLITTAPPLTPCEGPTPACGVQAFAGASSDYTHVIFEGNSALVPGAPGTGVQNLYESVGGQVRLVEILPDGTIPVGGGQPGGGESVGYNAVSRFIAGDVANAISADGSRIFFEAAADGGQPDPAQSGLTELYERVDGSSTTEISAPASGAAPANTTPEPAKFWAASSDGSRVFFTSSAELTTDSNTGSSNGGQNLYEFDTGTGALTDLTVDASPADASTGAAVQGVVGASSDGSYVYFVATGQLVAGDGVDGQPNLYLAHNGTVSYIATLSPSDANDWTATPAFLRAYVTPDGQRLAFMSKASLTGYDNTDQSTGKPDAEVYEYDAADGQLTCASCDPSGAAPVGDAFIGAADAAFGLSSTPFHQPRALSDDGSRLFFSSPDALTPGAGSPYAKVYEYQNGHVYLLGAATTANDMFLDASSTGDDVFIGTRDQLTPRDQDTLMDIYDARVDGGIAAPAQPSQCQGDACQDQPSSAPQLPTAATVIFTGPENTSTAASLAGSVRLVTRTVAGTSFMVAVKAPGNGRITITGRGVRATTKAISRAGTYRLRVTLTTSQKRALVHSHRLELELRVAYTDARGLASTASAALTVKDSRRQSTRSGRRGSSSAPVDRKAR